MGDHIFLEFFISRLLIPLLSIIGVIVFFWNAEKRSFELIKNLDKTCIMLYYSKAYRFVGIIGMFFPLAIGTVAMIQDSSFSILLIIPIILFVLGLYTYLYSTNWKLVFIKGASNFELTNVFGKKHIYEFSDCLYFNWRDEKLILKHALYGGGTSRRGLKHC